MVLEVCHLEGRQFPMTTNVHSYFRHMSNRSHSPWFSVYKVNQRVVFCFDHLDPVFVAEFSVNEVFCCSLVNHGIDSDKLLFAMLLSLDHDIVIVVFECIRVVECRVGVLHNDGFSFRSVPPSICYWEQSSFPDWSGS